MIIKRELYKYPLLIFDFFEVLFRTFIRWWSNFVFILGKKKKTSGHFCYQNGLHILTADSTGEITCNACLICEKQCPTQCITIEGQASKLSSFKIDMLKCTFCGLCQELCPIDAIYLGKKEIGPGLKQQNWTFDQEILAYRSDINASS